MSRQLSTLLAIALLTAIAPLAAAYEIYTWVDENGVVHYSESMPEENTAPVETIFIESTNPPGYDPDEYYWSVTRQADRIEADWTALQEKKAEERALDLERRLAEVERELAASEEARYEMFLPGYGFFGLRAKRHHRFFNRGFHHRSPHGLDRRPPHHSRDRRDTTSGPRPGWTAPQPPASAPPTPGFRNTGNP